MKINYFYFLFIIIFIFFSCVKSEKNSVTDTITLNEVPQEMVKTEEPEVINTNSNPDNVTTLDHNDNTIKLENLNEENENQYSDIQPADTFFLIKRNLDYTSFPNDFKIGLLQNTIIMDNTASHIYSILHEFCDNLLNNLIDEKIILDIKAEIIKNQLSSFLENENSIESYRIGEITLENTYTGTARTRFFSDRGSLNGNIFLTKQDDFWYISDLQFDFTGFESENNNNYKPEYYNIDVYGLNP